MKLLVIKETDHYFRFSDESFEACPMSKASVYPLAQYQGVAAKLNLLHGQGHRQAKIMQLTIHETEYTP